MSSSDWFLPSRPVESLASFDSEALRVRDTSTCGLAAFVALFNSDEKVLLVQLGDYCKARFEGNPWTLPGGAVEEDETPSIAAVRELREETNLALDQTALLPAGWFWRPYFQSHRGWNGELLLLFAALADFDTVNLRCRPPETIKAGFEAFTLSEFLRIPSRGVGKHRLQPMPGHFTYMTQVALDAIHDQLRGPVVKVFHSKPEFTNSASLLVAPKVQTPA